MLSISIKHFYFNHLVGILKKCVSHSPCSVCWITEKNLQSSWHEKGPNREMNVSYIVRDLWNLRPEC